LPSGDEIPCFGLTSPEAGSDAASMIDSGVICRGTFRGPRGARLRLNWHKRYITLGPVATVLGLAFKPTTRIIWSGSRGHSASRWR
jgi:acyl-CoA dehydrogenase